jgi:hypothetical protein
MKNFLLVTSIAVLLVSCGTMKNSHLTARRHVTLEVQHYEGQRLSPEKEATLHVRTSEERIVDIVINKVPLDFMKEIGSSQIRDKGKWDVVKIRLNPGEHWISLTLSDQSKPNTWHFLSCDEGKPVKFRAGNEYHMFILNKERGELGTIRKCWVMPSKK